VRYLVPGLLILTCILSYQNCGQSNSSQSNFTTLEGTVPNHALAQAQHLGPLPSDTQIQLAIGLAIKDPGALAQLISQIYNPRDPHYGKYLTSAQFAQQFLPTPDEANQVAERLKSLGLSVTNISSNVIDAQGPASVVQKAFQVNIDQYSMPDGRLAYSLTSDPMISADIAPLISGIAGLSYNVRRWYHSHTKVENSLIHPENTGTGPGGGLAPADIQKAYGLNTVSATGAGQTLGLVEFDGYHSSDVAAYQAEFGIANPPVLQNISVAGFNGTPVDQAGASEVTLDIDMMEAVAPGATKILVYEAPNNDTGNLDIYSKVASDNLAKEISVSWGSPEDDGVSATDFSTENAAFMQMAAQGQSIFVAAGDHGAYDDTSEKTTLVTIDPGSQPYVTCVGGTDLTINSGGYQSETTWNNVDGAGGGGISSQWSLPSWQTGLATATNLGSNSKRMVPDVSLNADGPGYATYFISAGIPGNDFNSTGWQLVGGTSAATPLWAAFAALVNQQRAANGLGPIGFLNPILYQLGQSSVYGQDFHDIADSSTNLHYPAVAGYDLATGLGSFNGGNLFSALVNPVLPPLPPATITGAPHNTLDILSWTASAGATTYNISRSTSASGPFTTIATGVSGTSYTDLSLTDGTTYYYEITAVDASGSSGASQAASVTPTLVVPETPTNFKLSVVGN
jgi:kumamolisin